MSGDIYCKNDIVSPDDIIPFPQHIVRRIIPRGPHNRIKGRGWKRKQKICKSYKSLLQSNNYIKASPDRKHDLIIHLIYKTQKKQRDIAKWQAHEIKRLHRKRKKMDQTEINKIERNAENKMLDEMRRYWESLGFGLNQKKKTGTNANK